MSRRLVPVLVALVPLLLAACSGEGDEGGGGACGGSESTMRPGENCLGCHSFKGAGTVYALGSAGACDGLAGVTVEIVGANATVNKTTNSAGNFYTGTNFGVPFTVTLTNGSDTVTHDHAGVGGLSGGCNGCHSPAGLAGARLHVP
jgi:hypothetical protein